MEKEMEKNELIRYRTFADALIRLNNAASVLLQEGANPEAIKLVLTGTAQLFSELEDRMASALSENNMQKIDLNFSSSGNIPIPPDSTLDNQIDPA
jgi:hypothetical protein